MFWLGLLVGIVAGVTGCYLGLGYYLHKGSWGG